MSAYRQTIASQAALIGASGPIYLNVCGSRYRSFSNCEVAKIHAFVVRELDETYSWIITGSDISISDAAAIIPPPVQDNNLMIRALENELSLVYSDREIRLINLLIDYIRNTRGHNSSSEVIGLSHFHTMWERMVHSTLKSVVHVNNQLSIPTYRFKDETLHPAPTKGQRTDTVIHNESTNRYVVIDAKYYGAKDLSSAPGWSDIVKQFFYAKALKIFTEGAEVDNVFVFPGDGPLKSVHMQNRQSMETQDDKYPPIKCFYIQPMDLLEYYVSGRIYKDFSNRLMSIEGST
ncbi:LlaJI family restriction endonuclease [Thalassolituus oleivorans]|uniref:LlaJI family restriction endonuclease n=1 Tax=Thalassolituus oleivorans TaxID=187493 RepID=UPI0023EF5F71|nr:LlaJI family restriction endonuclease [Thalassolituus oleivorans]